MIQTKRVYEPASDSDGVRVLVDRLWPRGVAKADAQIDAWLKDIAPSDALRVWFDHKPDRWEAFCGRYAKELDANQDAVVALRSLQARNTLTLVYSAKDETHNNAVALKSYLDRS